MKNECQEVEQEPIMTRRGFPVYLENPSIANAFPIRVASKSPKKVDSAYMISPGTGEVISKGTFAFVEEKIVDSEKFVKVYLDGIKRYGQLSKAGMTIFEFVYMQISGKSGKDKDTIMLNHQLAMLWKPTITRSTFFRGMKELLEKEFLFRTIAADSYFVNIRFMFNGDRLALVDVYSRGKSQQQALTDDNDYIEHS